MVSPSKRSRDHRVHVYRRAMVSYLVESYQMTEKLLSEADFEDAFPHVFGHPNEGDARVSVRNEYGILLRKAQAHILAVHKANKSNNLHSLAVHMRVILECAAQVQSTAHAVCIGSERELKRVFNTSEYDFQNALISMSRGKIGWNQIQEMIVSAREGIGPQGSEKPRKVRIADKIRFLTGEKEWYDHLSTCFCGGEASTLAGDSFYGGVTSIDTEKDELAFAIFLDYLAEQIIKMLVGVGFLLIGANGDSQPFDDAIHLSERKRDATQSLKDAILQRLESQ